MRDITTQPLVIQELTAFYTGPLRDALRVSPIRHSFGDAATGAEFDDMAFDNDTGTVLVEVIGDGASESGRVVAYGRGREIVFNAIADFTAKFGTPATFVTELSDKPEPLMYRDGVARMVR